MQTTVLNVTDTLDAKTGGVAHNLRRTLIEFDKLCSVEGRVFCFKEVSSSEKWSVCPQKQADLDHLTAQFQIIHQHGLWLLPYHRICQVAVKSKVSVVWSPHGMLEPWALKYHQVRKKMAMALYQKKDLLSARLFHATSSQEAESIRALGLLQPIAVIPYGVDLPDLKQNSNAAVLKKSFGLPPKKIILFLSRIHPKKGLDMLLSAWDEHKKHHQDWHLVIAGDGNKNYVERLKNSAKKFGESITWTGFVEGYSKERLWQCANLFILPTYSENFGNVIPEAMSYGLPVITTKATPWQILESDRCGWWVDATQGVISKTLGDALKKSSEELCEMGARGRALAAARFDWSDTAKRMFEMYRWGLNPNLDKPDFIRID